MVEKFASGRKTFEVILLNLIGCLFANLQCESLFFNGLNDLVLSTFILFCSTRCVLNIPLSCVLLHMSIYNGVIYKTNISGC